MYIQKISDRAVENNSFVTKKLKSKSESFLSSTPTPFGLDIGLSEVFGWRCLGEACRPLLGLCLQVHGAEGAEQLRLLLRPHRFQQVTAAANAAAFLTSLR